MPNPDPIQVDNPPVETGFQIPAVNSGDQLTLTIKITSIPAGWKYVISSQVFLDGNDIYPARTPEPTKLLLDKGSNLNGKSLLVLTKVTLVYTAGSFAGNPPVFVYTLSFDTGTNNIEAFQKSSVSNFLTNFNSELLFH
jgi:hypothetical protein